jgi:hypothetical protein
MWLPSVFKQVDPWQQACVSGRLGGGGPGCLNMFLHANLPTRWSTQLGERLQM